MKKCFGDNGPKPLGYKQEIKIPSFFVEGRAKGDAKTRLGACSMRRVHGVLRKDKWQRWTKIISKSYSLQLTY